MVGLTKWMLERRRSGYGFLKLSCDVSICGQGIVFSGKFTSFPALILASRCS